MLPCLPLFAVHTGAWPVARFGARAFREFLVCRIAEDTAHCTLASSVPDKFRISQKFLQFFSPTPRSMYMRERRPAPRQTPVPPSHQDIRPCRFRFSVRECLRGGFSSPGSLAPSGRDGISRPCLAAASAGDGPERVGKLGDRENSLVPQFFPLFGAQAREEAQIILFKSLFAAAVLKLTFRTVPVQRRIRRRLSGQQFGNRFHSSPDQRKQGGVFICDTAKPLPWMTLPETIFCRSDSESTSASNPSRSLSSLVSLSLGINRIGTNCAGFPRPSDGMRSKA